MGKIENSLVGVAYYRIITVVHKIVLRGLPVNRLLCRYIF